MELRKYANQMVVLEHIGETDKTKKYTIGWVTEGYEPYADVLCDFRNCSTSIVRENHTDFWREWRVLEDHDYEYATLVLVDNDGQKHYVQEYDVDRNECDNTVSLKNTDYNGMYNLVRYGRCVIQNNRYNFQRVYIKLLRRRDTVVCTSCANRLVKTYKKRNKTPLICDKCVEAIEKINYASCSSCELGDYHWKPRAMFDKALKRKKVLHMGFELEVDLTWYERNNGDDDYPNRDEARNVICNLNTSTDNYVYNKYDGSLNNGIEIVSQPRTLEYHMSRKDEMADIMGQLIDTDWRSEAGGACGFHIHCDKQYLGKDPDFVVAKMIIIFGMLKEELVAISRRRDFGYCVYTAKKGESLGSAFRKAFDDERHSAINNTNRNTVEVRLWRGTLNPATFYATLDLTQAIVEVAKHYSLHRLQHISMEDLYAKMTYPENVEKIKALVEKGSNNNDNNISEEE